MQALDQIRVVEIGPGVAISFAGKLFADFGADVIKVEEPGGDPSRRAGPFPHDRPDPERSAAFGFFNRNKRGVTLSLAASGSRPILADLAASADLILAALPLPQLADLGLSLEVLAARRPGIVVASLTPWGEDGPYAGFAVTQLVADAIAGPVSVSGRPPWPPMSKPMNLVAAQVGNALASASLGAVLAARHSGEAQLVQVSATDMLMTQMDRRAMCLLGYDMTGDITERPFGAARDTPLPRGRHQCLDGQVEIVTAPPWVPRMLATLDDPALSAYFADHPDAAVRPETADQIEPVLTAWLASRTRTECFEQATLGHGWPVFPVNPPHDVVNSPNFVDRGCFVEFDHPVAGPQRQLGPPWRMAEGGFQVRRPAPVLGQHNAEVFGDELGRDEAAVAAALEVS
jgi:crotonobetainyl-CoA:carnitine CoA-transferase CaiB-like acyl-CoA transferase